MGNILIATVGTSIITNIKRNLGDSITRDSIKNYLSSKKLDERDMGAEINSIYNLINSNKITPDIFYLIVSDTEDGQLTAQVINEILIERMNFRTGKNIIIEGLNSEKENEFARKGLRNLVAQCAEIISKHNPNDIVITPIGGFKAQIFMTGLLAQVFGIKSYYMFEAFNEVIELMPLPISFDYDLFSRNIEFFTLLAGKNELVELSEVSGIIEKEPILKNLIKEEKIDGKKYVEFSAIGEVFYNRFAIESKRTLPKESNNMKNFEKDFTYNESEGHSKASLNDGKLMRFLKDIHKKPYVEKIITNYFNKDGKGSIVRFSKSSNKEEGRVIKLEYNNSNGINGYIIYTTAENEKEIDAAIIDLRELI
jgi:putative CRISPR-associated protein (TIGR02619 family)